MIGLLRGRIADRTEEGVVIVEVGGVGFEVHVPPEVSAMPPGTETTLHVHTVVRDDAIALHGFGSRAQLSAFRLLLTVKNIGPKLAMSVLATLPPEEIAAALTRGESERFRRVPGIGSKTAQLIVVELRDKVRKLEREAPSSHPTLEGRLAELASALEHLGFKPAQAAKAAIEARDQGMAGAELETLVREALKRMS